MLIYFLQTTENIPGIMHFCLGLLIPFLSNVGMNCSDRLNVVSYAATASKSLENDSYDFWNIEGKFLRTGTNSHL